MYHVLLAWYAMSKQDGSTDGSRNIDRRSVLRGLGATTIGTAILGSGVGSASHCPRLTKYLSESNSGGNKSEILGGTARYSSQAQTFGEHMNAEAYAQGYGSADAWARVGVQYTPSVDGTIEWGNYVEVVGNLDGGNQSAELRMKVYDETDGQFKYDQVVNSWDGVQDVSEGGTYVRQFANAETEHNYILFYELSVHVSAFDSVSSADFSYDTHGGWVRDSAIYIRNQAKC